MTSGGASFALRLGIGGAMTMVLVAVVTYAGSSVTGTFPIWLADVLLWGGLVSTVVIVLRFGRRVAPPSGTGNGVAAEVQDPSLVRRVTGAAAGLLPFVVLAPGVTALLSSPRLQMSFHGYLHSAYTYQAINGYLPPDNPLLAGEPANDYWLFHVLLGAVSHTLRVAPPVAAAMVNVAALVGCAGAIAWMLGRLDLSPSNALLRSCAILFVLFGLNLFGLVHVGANALWGEAATDPAGIGTMVWSGAARSAGLFAKFLNFSGFALGAAFFLMALAGAVALTRSLSATAVACLLAGLVGALAFHVTTGLFGVATVPLSVCGSWLVTKGRPQRRAPAKRLGAIAFSGAALLAVVGHYVMRAASSLEQDASIDLWNHTNVLRFLGVTYPLWPFFFVGAASALRARRTDLVALAFVALTGAVCACIAVLPDDNQYKFDYLTAIPLAVVALAGWQTAVARRGSTTSALVVGVGAAAIVLVLGNQLYQGISYLRSPMASRQTLAYDGLNVVGAQGASQAEAWEWIREYAPSDAVVVTPAVSKNRAPVLAMSQRLVYVLDGGPFTAGNPEFVARKQTVDVLYSATASRNEKIQALETVQGDLPSRPVIVAIPPPYRDAVERTVLDLGADLVFDRGGTSLYRLTAG